MKQTKLQLSRAWKALFRKDKSIFCHAPDGTPCPICGKPMKRDVILTAVYGKLHARCWPEALKRYVLATIGSDCSEWNQTLLRQDFLRVDMLNKETGRMKPTTKEAEKLSAYIKSLVSEAP